MSDAIRARAAALLDQAVSLGWTSEVMTKIIIRYALQAEGYDPEIAADAVAWAWRAREDDGA